MTDGSRGEKGPNGFPYVDPAGLKTAGWENGDYKLQVTRADGETMVVNFTSEQMAAFEEQIRDIRRQHEGGVDDDGE